MKSVTFHARGLPTPKGSTVRMRNGAMLPAGTNESRKRMAQWRDDVRNAAMSAMGEEPPWTGAVRLFVSFAMPVPVSMRKRDIGWIGHTKQPDVDKLFRMVGDALTNIVWCDDSQVCYANVSKRYAWDGITGAIVEVAELDENHLRYLANGVIGMADVL